MVIFLISICIIWYFNPNIEELDDKYIIWYGRKSRKNIILFK